jgi:hypothetical protein
MVAPIAAGLHDKRVASGSALVLADTPDDPVGDQTGMAAPAAAKKFVGSVTQLTHIRAQATHF